MKTTVKVMEFVTLMEMCARFGLDTPEQVTERVACVFNHVILPEQKLLFKEIQMVADVYQLDIEIVVKQSIPPPPLEEEEQHYAKPDYSASAILASILTTSFSDAHFVAKTIADGMLKVADMIPVAEAKLVSKLTKEPQGNIIEDRHNTTARKQESVVKGFKNIGDFISTNTVKAHSHVMEVIHETMVTNPTD